MDRRRALVEWQVEAAFDRRDIPIANALVGVSHCRGRSMARLTTSLY